MLNLASSLLARLADILVPLDRRPEPLAIPIRHDDQRLLRRDRRL